MPRTTVEQIVYEACTAIGRFAAFTFGQDCVTDHDDLITSPIERILYTAIKAVAAANFISLAEDPIEENGEWHVPGLHISPQFKIKNYRADFKISHERKFRGKWEYKTLIVECDSQQFHERTEPERRYEKKRDRFFLASGYSMLHFTGSEIVNGPWEVAAEILAAVCTDRPLKEDLVEAFATFLNDD